MNEVDKIHNVYHTQSMLCRVGLLETLCFRSIAINEYWTLEGDILSVLNLNHSNIKQD